MRRRAFSLPSRSHCMHTEAVRHYLCSLHGFARAQILRIPKNHNTRISVRGTPSNHKIIGMATSSLRAVFVRTSRKHDDYTFMVTQ